MGQLILINALCKFSYFRLWYLKFLRIFFLFNAEAHLSRKETLRLKNRKTKWAILMLGLLTILFDVTSELQQNTEHIKCMTSIRLLLPPFFLEIDYMQTDIITLFQK